MTYTNLFKISSSILVGVGLLWLLPNVITQMMGDVDSQALLHQPNRAERREEPQSLVQIYAKIDKRAGHRLRHSDFSRFLEEFVQEALDRQGVFNQMVELHQNLIPHLQVEMDEFLPRDE